MSSLRHSLVAAAGLGLLNLPCGHLPGADALAPDRASIRRGVEKTVEKGFEVSKVDCAKGGEQTVSLEEERALGDAVALNWVGRSGGLALEVKGGQAPKGPRNDATRYLNRVGRYLAQGSTRPELAWTFGILADDGFAAFSAPGGYVLVTRGLLKKVRSESELAGVLAHEIAHIEEQHSLGAYRASKVDACVKWKAAEMSGAGAGGVVEHGAGRFVGHSLASKAGDFTAKGAAIVVGNGAEWVVKNLVETGFSRTQEDEADQRAVELLAGAGYAPEPFIRFLEKLPTDGGHVFTHHPPNAARAKALRQLVAARRKEGKSFEAAALASGRREVPLGKELAAALK